MAALQEPKSEVLICKDEGQCSPVDVTVLRCDDPIDIAVLVPSTQLTVSFPLEPNATGAIFGQDMYFLGFLFGGFQLATRQGVPINEASSRVPTLTIGFEGFALCAVLIIAKLQKPVSQWLPPKLSAAHLFLLLCSNICKQ